MPDVARINRRLSVGKVDTMFNAVDFLNERHLSREDNDDLLARRMPFPSRPARVAGADHHESPFIAVGAVLGGVSSEERRGPLEVRNGNGSRPQAEMNVGCQQIEA